MTVRAKMDILDIARIGIIGLVGAVLTPAIMNIWSKYSSPKIISESEQYSHEELHERNIRINTIASVISVAGIFIALSFYYLGIPKSNPWPVGLGFGLMVILPVAYISIVTLSKGEERFKEFWRFYELHYNIGIKSLTIVYVLFSFLGLVSAYQLVFNA